MAADNARYGNASGPKRAPSPVSKAPSVSSCEGKADSRVTDADAHKAKANP